MSAANDTSNPEMRATGIGGSDAAAILGISSYGSPYSVAMEKLHGIREERTDEEEERLAWGKRLEPLIIDAFQAKTGMHVGPGRAWARHPEHPFLFANVDGLITAGTEEVFQLLPDKVVDCVLHRHRWTPVVPEELAELGPGVFEGKCAGQDDGWGTWREPQVPTSYWAQAQHYMGVLGLRWAGFGALINGNRLEVRFIARDDAWLDTVWQPKLVAFWDDIHNGRVPEPWNPDVDEPVLKARYPDGAAGAKHLSDEETRTVYAWARAREQSAEAKRQDDQLTLRVRAIMGDHSIGILTTGEQITYKKTSAGSRMLRQPHKAK